MSSARTSISVFLVARLLLCEHRLFGWERFGRLGMAQAPRVSQKACTTHLDQLAEGGVEHSAFVAGQAAAQLSEVGLGGAIAQYAYALRAREELQVPGLR